VNTLSDNPESYQNRITKIQTEIKELESQRLGILAFNDVVTADQPILDNIEKQLEALNQELSDILKTEKNKIFTVLARVKEAHTSTNGHKYTILDMKNIINGVLSGTNTINQVPKMEVPGEKKNLRDKVKRLLAIQLKK
jgi:hypothetical protein